MDNLNKIYQANASKELTEYHVYSKLADMEKNPENRALLEQLSKYEKSHYDFWQSLIPTSTITSSSLTVYSIAFLRVILGITFIAKFLEKDQKNVIESHTQLLQNIPAEHKKVLEEIIEDESSRERALIDQFTERRVSYISFIVLGLADAIVEITGVHAGFLGVTGSTLIAGISGVIVGFSAAISMGSASYLQAKQEPEKSPIISGLATGLAYFFSVILLALPYFLIRTMIVAFGISTCVGIILIAGFTFYGAVVFDRKFLREFLEATGLMLTTAVLTFILGTVISNLFHIHASSF